MNLYIWNSLIINNESYSIYALAKDLNSAKEIALNSTTSLTKDELRAYVNMVSPIIYNEPSSFVKLSSAQLI